MPIRTVLRTRLTAAMKARDASTMAAYRSALSAIANAEALPVDTMPAAGAIESSAVGVGATEATRRHLTEDDLREIVLAEIDERRQAGELLPSTATELDTRLKAEIAALQAVLES